MKYLLVLLVLALTLAQNTEPVPSCLPHLKGLNDLPVAINENQLYDIDAFFTGFNLQFSLSSEAPSFVHLGEKLEKVGSSNDSLAGLRNYHIESVNNTWGNNFILLTEVNYTSVVKWGKIAAPDALPVISGSVVVETEANVDCFDAVRFNDQGVIIVDCAAKSGSPGAYVYRNRFLYVNMTSQKVMSNVVSNKLYADFRSIFHRRMFRYTEDGYHYLIRVYFAEGVDAKNRENTYMQVFTANNPLKPYILRVLDRSFLSQKKLAIVDFKIYLGDFYILDYYNGIARFDITPSQQIVITGKFVEEGYLKFAVYSDDLNREYMLALANHHAVYEYDWTSHSAPKLLTKYSLMSGSRVDSVAINQFYVVVQAQANVSHTGSSFYTIYNTTWVFTRNSRTYSHAYVAIMHDSFNTFVAFNMDHSILLSFDEEGIDLYRLNFPILGIYPQTGSPVNTEYIFTVNAVSINHVTHENMSCSFTWRSVVVNADNYSLWETIFAPSETYYANYPGGLEIDLAPYVLGPNITYGLEESTAVGEVPEYIILQQNASTFKFQKEMNLGNVTFLRQEQYESSDNETLYMYLQDSKFNFFVQECVSTAIDSTIYCKELFSTTFNSTLLNLTANRFHYYNGQYRHLVGALVASNRHVVHIHNMETGEHFNDIHLPPGISGEVSNIEFLGEFLVITMKYAKAIHIYDMIWCEDYARCDRPVFTIDTDTMKHIGINYFAPLQVYTSDFHPYVMFIQNMDSVIIIDFAATGIRLLQEISSSATKELGYYGWRMAISRDHLVIVNAPDIIEEYFIGALYQKKVISTRNYPLYNYIIPDVFDVDFSDASDLIYITAQDKTTRQGKILVYRAGYPTVMAFYDEFNMNGAYTDTLIDATGYFADFLVLATGSQLTVFRQFAVPILIIYDTFSDFTFNITYRNDQNKHRLSTSTVKIANYPVDIKINNNQLNNQTYLNSLIEYNDDLRYYTIRDEDWFNGTVLNYTMSCETECKGHEGKVILVDHVHLRERVFASYGMYDYHFTIRGGVVQQGQALLRINHNGSAHDYISMPTEGNGEVCLRVTVDFVSDYFVSACKQGESDILLYLTSENGYKPFTMGPYLSNADHVAKIEIMGDLLFLTDVDENFHERGREGGVIIYRINHDSSLVDAFEEVEVIDSNDFTDANGWTEDRAFIGGSHVVWTNDSSLYRLVMTETRHGLFVTDFKWINGRSEIVVVKTNFINVRQLLGNISMPLPNDAHFAGVTIINEVYNGLNEYWMIDVVVTIRGFHSFQLNILIDKAGAVLHTDITRIYEKYSYYLCTNYLKAFDGYFAVIQELPSFLHHMVNYSKQVVAVYDTRPNRTNPQYHKINGVETGIETLRMMGGIEIDDLGDVTYDFNFTIRRNESDPFSNISLVVIDPLGEDIKQVTIHESLHIITRPGIETTQNIKLTARNHWSKVELPFTIVINPDDVHHKLAWWAILLIVLGSVAVAAVGGYFAWRYWKARQILAESGDANKSLLEREAEEEEDEENEEEDEETQETKQELQEPAPGADVVEPTVEAPEAAKTSAPVVPEPATEVPVPVENPQTRSGAINESVQE